MKLRYLLVLLCMGQFSIAQAEIYKYVDREGHVTYSSTPTRGAKKLHLEPLSTMEPVQSHPHSETESTFPRVNESTQRHRDNTRRQILENELESERKLLEQAKQKLQLAKDTPMVYHTKDGRTFRNVARYQQNVKSAQDEVDLHQKNIDALNTELSQLK